MKTAVEWLESEILEHYSPFDNKLLYEAIHKAKEMEKEQKIKMLNTFLCNAQMGEDVEDVEAWFEDYEKQQSFFKPVLGEPIWNITNRTTKQQEQ
jgi:hypothetical protein